MYGHEVLALLRFIARAWHLGFSLTEIRDITVIRRAGQPPCPHVQQLVRRKLTLLDQTLRELMSSRRALRGMLASWPSSRSHVAAVCPHIEEGGESDGAHEGVPLSGVRACPEVEILDGEVRIGEAGNLAVLRTAEWNVLVDLIRSGQLTRL